MLRAATGAEHNHTPEDIDRLIGDLVWCNPASRWEIASIKHLISSGDLAVFSDRILVQRLASLHRELEAVRASFRLDEAKYRDKMLPFLGANANLSQIFASNVHGPHRPDLTYDFPDIDVADVDDHKDLLSNAEFRGLLAAKIDIQLDILKFSLEGRDDDLDEVALMLEDELNR